jgi:uridine phosphorylase
VHVENMNRAFLDPVVEGTSRDVYYHLGLASDDHMVAQMGDLRAIVMAGSGERIDTFAQRWSASHGDAPILHVPKEERFVLRYTAGVLFVSHGMGMPSASIAVQELMKLVYFLKKGDTEEMDKIFWARVGTSGGVGLPGGTIVVSTEGVMADLKPYRLLDGHGGYHWFDGTFPRDVGEAIVAVNADSGIPMALRQDSGGQRVLHRAVPSRWRDRPGNSRFQDAVVALAR